MAIGQSFSQQFKAGDVIYGISQARSPYVNSLPPPVAHHLRAVGQFLICDEFNNRTFGRVPTNDFGIGQSPDSKRSIKTNLAHHQQVDYLNPLQKAALQEYYDALKGTRYAPLETVKTKINKLMEKGNQNTEDLIFRRACKFGLQFVIQQRQRTVHFVLDVPEYFSVPGNRIDSLGIVTKVKHAGHVPITTSELRCCYRNRKAWIPAGRLKFYFKLIEVNPPWVDDAAMWAIYEAHRIEKGVI
ncbi:hypothetical protein [Chitinimonas sp. BJB300]|uniref:hypothetical protein n=1 Tax=Chitinimonas sp. BJB300 TaxID=1559339 RepID=UPI000C0D6C54|nr:hypothetical protein [Chitinimonas sp. BJB300]PHV13164.1 hypothetical protein CSQ89_01845 [Chitinimonas sp. BJB300]TSJ87146.1 hypothetical protein FG002_015345 [Chitinimonas sp. BJB300]